MEEPRELMSVVFSKVRMNTYKVDKGNGLVKHEHTYPHLTYCYKGSIVVRKEGKELTVTPDMPPVYLVANEWHEIEALEDGTIFQNIFAEG